jgi:hypothetical protein
MAEGPFCYKNGSLSKAPCGLIVSSMSPVEFQALRMGDRVLVHDRGSGYRLRQGVVIYAGHFDPERPGAHVKVQLVGSTAVLYPSWERIHYDPRDPHDYCQFCERLGVA